jgi:large subunit ribosomal protein L19
MANAFTFNEQVVNVGDTVRVHQRIQEAGKTRIQVFEGIVIGVQNAGVNKTFTVRRVGANGVGVEKIMPITMPGLEKIQVKAQGDVRRAKLYYLRQRQGKAATRVKEKSAVRPTTTAA